MQETTVFKLSCCSWFLARDRPGQLYHWAIPCSYPEIIFPGIHVTLSGGSDWVSTKSYFRQRMALPSVASLTCRLSALERAENGTETLQVSATVPACRGKKDKVKDIVIIPLEDKSWWTETVGQAMQRNNSRKEMVRLQHGKSHQ